MLSKEEAKKRAKEIIEEASKSDNKNVKEMAMEILNRERKNTNERDYN